MKDVLYPDGGLPPARYLRVSRHALAPAACAVRGLTHDLADVAFLPAENQTFADVCRVYGLPLGDFGGLLERHRLAADTPLVGHAAGYRRENRRRFDRLRADPDFDAAVRRAAGPAHEAMLAYLEEMDFFRFRRVALVDVGWIGTMQRFLGHALADDPRAPELHGFLLAKNDGYPFPATERNRLRGFVLDGSDNVVGGLLTLFKVQMEEALRGDEPSLWAYERDAGGSAKLVFRTGESFERERRQSLRTQPLRDGILAASKPFAHALRVAGFDPRRDLMAWINFLVLAHVGFPTRAERKAWDDLEHVNEMAGSNPVSTAIRRAGRTIWNTPDGPWGLRTLRHLRGYVDYLLGCLRRPPNLGKGTP
jgi:hypothetical protein